MRLGEDRRTDAETLEQLDRTIVDLLARRIELARRIIACRVADGGCRYRSTEEVATVHRFRPLGPAGSEIAVILLRAAQR